MQLITTCPEDGYCSAIPKHDYMIRNSVCFSKWLHSSIPKEVNICTMKSQQHLMQTYLAMQLIRGSLSIFWMPWGFCTSNSACTWGPLPVPGVRETSPCLKSTSSWKVQLEKYCCYNPMSQALCKIRNRSITFIAKQVCFVFFPCLFFFFFNKLLTVPVSSK